MKIFHVSSFPVSMKSKNGHAVSIKLSHGFVRNGHNVIDYSDRDVARSWGFGHRRWGKRKANETFVDLCCFHKPDLILLGHADVITRKSISIIRSRLKGVRIWQWNVDPLFDSDNVDRIKAKIDLVDGTLVSTAGLSPKQFVRPNHVVGFLPNPTDISIETGLAHEEPTLPFDVFYACGNPNRPLRHAFGRAWNMNDFVAELCRLSPGLRTCMPGIGGSPLLAGSAYQSALEQAAIGLNISRRPDYYLYSSDRIAHLAGNGLAICMERGSGYEDIFSEDEILFSSSLEEMAEHINMLRSSPSRRQEVAAAGRRRYIALFNERKVARYVEEIAFDRLNPHNYEWPTIV